MGQATGCTDTAGKGKNVIIACIRMHGLPEKRVELLQTIGGLADDIRNADGCIESHCFQNCENENTFLLLNTWKNGKALNEFIQSNRFSVLMGAKILLHSSPDIRVYSISQSSKVVDSGASGRAIIEIETTEPKTPL